MTSFHERFKSKIVVALVCQCISAIVFTGVEDKFVLQKEGDYVEAVTTFELRKGLNEWHGYKLVVFHAHLDSRQHAEMILG